MHWNDVAESVFKVIVFCNDKVLLLGKRQHWSFDRRFWDGVVHFGHKMICEIYKHSSEGEELSVHLQPLSQPFHSQRIFVSQTTQLLPQLTT